MYFHPKNSKSGSTVVPRSYATLIDHIPAIEHMSVIEHIPVIERMLVIKHMPVIEQKIA